MELPRHLHNKVKLAISGAANTDKCGEASLELTRELGKEIAASGAILITGATSGIPLWASRGAKEAGGMVIGLSPAINEKEHVEIYKLPLDYTDFIIYTGEGYPGRDILLTRMADAIFIGCGRIGTFHEFTVAFEEGKPIGILKGEYMTDELMEEIIKQSGRAADDPYVVYDENPKKLLEKIMEIIKKTKMVD